ncbi:Urk1 protein [Candida orthopsilosis Co 90-125]|uniref:Uridine kinase n=1 Tax=Candida orthopsilosis (strain 90-125) TaxID=1136231 RepID=H8X3U1_CANO9|nr:Urk1 protein [Candida orthopsilosis Co 90-125]CCG25729.1 Urk1 protein [Candida orthopsilosis Co 90-125]
MSSAPKQRRFSRIVPTQNETSSFISLGGDTGGVDDENNNESPFQEEDVTVKPSQSFGELKLEEKSSRGICSSTGYSNLSSIVSPTLGVSHPSKLGHSSFVSPSESTVSVSSTSLSTVSKVNLPPELLQDEQLHDKIAHSSYIPPWTAPYIIGIAGNSGSGKTSISQQIIQGINQPWTVLLSFDNFYKSLSPEESRRAFANEYDFDTPRSLDLDAVVETVRTLKRGGKSIIPVYSFAKHARTDKTNTVYGANVIIVEGLYALYDPRLLEMMDLKIYVDTDLDICLSRRLIRDILYRGRDLNGAIKQWTTFVKPNAVKYINPTKENADLVIPRGLDNTIAIDLMIKHIKNQLALKSKRHLQNLKSLGYNIEFKVENYPNLKLLKPTNQLRGINSILFNKNTSRDDFIFYFNRLSGLLIEYAQSNFFDFKSRRVTCFEKPYKYQGMQAMQTQMVAVSIIRSGDCFMTSLKKTFPELTVGKMLIQSDSSTGEPQLHYESLPHNISSIGRILLLDSQTISGAGAIMAIQVLVDHKVKQEDIIFVSYLSTEIGIRRILNVFPSVKLVIGKLSSMDATQFEQEEGEEDDRRRDSLWYNEERFLDSHWHFRNRFIDSLYFGTN